MEHACVYPKNLAAENENRISFFGRQTGVQWNTLQSTGETAKVPFLSELLFVENKTTELERIFYSVQHISKKVLEMCWRTMAVLECVFLVICARCVYCEGTISGSRWIV